MRSFWLHLSTVFALAIGFLPPQCAVQAQGWKWQNPTPHGLTVNDAVILEGYLNLAVCESGYVMRSGDEGRNWTTYRLADGDLTDIETTPSGRVFAVSTDEGLYFSDDLGGSWEKRTLPTGTPSGESLITMVDDSIGIAIMGSSDMYRTTDGGDTWTLLSWKPVEDEKDMTLSFQPPRTLWLRSTSAVSTSTDLGASWNRQAEIDPRIFQRVAYADSLYGYQCNSGSLFRTLDGGATWKEMDVFGFDVIRNVLAGGAMGNTVICLTSGQFVVSVSTDKGETWNVSLTEEAFANTAAASVAFANERYGIITGKGGRILRTTNGGMSWTVVHGIGYLADMTNIIAVDPNSAFALTSTSTVMITKNGGERWQEIIPDPQYVMEYAAMYSSTEGYAIGNDKNGRYAVFHIQDSGRTWAKRGTLSFPDTIREPCRPYSIYAISKDSILIGANYGLLYRSNDGGMNWDSSLVLRLSSFLRNTGVFAFSPNIVVYGTPQGYCISSDGGNSWSKRFLPLSKFISHMQFLSPERCFIIASNQLGCTTNGGTDWNFYPEDKYRLLHFFDDTTGVAYISHSAENPFLGAIQWTQDGGETWTTHPLNEKTTWNAWFWLDKNTGWVCGPNGLIRATKNSGIANAAPPQIATTFHLEQNYPNPFSLAQDAAATIAFSLPEGVHLNVTLTLRDAFGREVSRLVEGSMHGGRHYVTLGRQHFGPKAASGVYYYSLEAGGFFLTRKIVVMR